MANPDVLDEVAAAYRAKTDLVSNRLNEIAVKHGITPAPVPCAPRATFYVWASFSGVPGVDTDLELQRFVRDMHARDEADGLAKGREIGGGGGLKERWWVLARVAHGQRTAT